MEASGLANRFVDALEEDNTVLIGIMRARLSQTGSEEATQLARIAWRWLKDDRPSPNEALLLAQRAVALQPDSDRVHTHVLAYAEFRVGNVDEAVRLFREAMGEGSRVAPVGLAMALAARGRPGDVVEACEALEHTEERVKDLSYYTGLAHQALREALPQQPPDLQERIQRLLVP